MSTPRAGTEESRERKIALFWTLVRAHETRAPISQAEIVASLEIDEFPPSGKIPTRKRAYEGKDNAVRQKFERDKAAIRDLGFEIQTHQVNGEVEGYSIDPASVYIAPLDLAPDEMRLVSSAMDLLGLGGTTVARLFGDSLNPTPGTGLDMSPMLGPILRAIGTQRAVGFKYRRRDGSIANRSICPLDVLVRHGQPYVIGVDERDGTVKGFRVSRMESTPVLQTTSLVVTDEQRTRATAWVPKLDEPAPLKVSFVTSPNFARLLAWSFPIAPDLLGNGEIEVHAQFDSPSSARRALLSCGDRIRKVKPKTVREEMLAWLAKVNRPERNVKDVSFSPVDAGVDVLGQSLALISAVYQSPDPIRASTLAQRFGIDVELVKSIMSRVMAMQYVRDSTRYLVHIEPGDDDDEPEDPQYARSASYDSSEAAALAPITWRDAVQLLVALKQAANQHPDDALGRVVAKVEAATSASLRVESVEPEFLSVVRDAIDQHQQLKVLYFSASADAPTDRWIEPRAMVARAGRWYTRAFCANRQRWLTFRVDRIIEVLAIGPGETHDDDPVENWAELSNEEGREVTLAVRPEARWLVEPLAGVRFVTIDEGLEAARVRVASDHFLDQLLVEAGPYAWVISGGDDKAGRDLARRMSRLI